MQISPAATMDAAPTPTTSTPDAPAAGAFEQTLSNALSPPAPPGPEPPGSPPPTGKTGAEEAATAPNALSQKLDSPHQTPNATIIGVAKLTDSQLAIKNVSSTKSAKKPAPNQSNDSQTAPQQVVPTSVALITAVQQAALPIADSKPAPKAVEPTQAITAKKQPVSSVQQPKSATTDEPSVKQPQPAQTQQALPQDAEVPIVGVQVTPAQATTPRATPEATTAQPTSTTNPINPVAGSGVPNQNAGQDATPGQPGSQPDATPGKAIIVQGPSKPANAVTAPDAATSAQTIAATAATSAKVATIGSTHAAVQISTLDSVKGLDRAALVKQVADKAEMAIAGSSKGGVTIQLSPKDLGSITLTMKSVGSAYDTQIAATNDHVRTALEQSRPDLMQAMQSKGYDVSNLSFSQSNSEANAFAQRQAAQQQQQQARQNAASPQLTYKHNEETTQDANPGRRTGNSKGVDVWI